MSSADYGIGAWQALHNTDIRDFVFTHGMLACRFNHTPCGGDAAGDFESLHELLSKTPQELVAMSSAAREAASLYDCGSAAPRFVQHYRQVLTAA